jgi:nitroreductase
MEKMINKAIQERISTYPRNFKPGEKIPNTTIESILENAVWAPTHKLTQPWYFIVFEGQGVQTFFEKQSEIYQEITPVEKISGQKLQKYKDKAEQVSHVIAIIAKHDVKERIPAIEEVVATSCALQNIYLSLASYGIAGYLSTGDVCYAQQMADFLELGEGDKVLGFFQLGIAKDDLPKPNRKRIPAKEKTVWRLR